jgi:polysaccharide deacetylase 2 family uncharacterized protein YibQ
VIGKLLRSLRRRGKEEIPSSDDDLETSDEEEEDVPFSELPYEEQYRLLPKRPPSRRTRLSKALLVALWLLPFGAVGLISIPVLDSQTGWDLFHAGSPRIADAIPGTERSLQDEIAQGVLDAEARNRAEEEARRKAIQSGVKSPDGSSETPSGQAGSGDNANQPGNQTGNGGATAPDQQGTQPEPIDLSKPIEPDPLPEAPIAGLEEEGSYGRVPRIADDGRTPAKAYARPFEVQDGKAYVGIIVTGLGLNQTRTENAIKELPLNISLAISPYATDPRAAAAAARKMGHEVFLQLPMEPDDFPLSDPGPRALMTSQPEGENLVRLEWLLARFPGYVGVVGHMGTKFANLDSAIRPVIESLHRAGLMYVNGSNPGSINLAAQLASNAGMPNAITDYMIDDVPSRRNIDARLSELVHSARRKGVAIGIAQSYPVTISRLRRWAAGLARQNVILAPVSALQNRQVTPQSSEEAQAAREEAQKREQAAAAKNAANETGNGDAQPAPDNTPEQTIEGH